MLVGVKVVTRGPCDEEEGDITIEPNEVAFEGDSVVSIRTDKMPLEVMVADAVFLGAGESDDFFHFWHQNFDRFF